MIINHGLVEELVDLVLDNILEDFTIDDDKFLAKERLKRIFLN